MDALIEHCSVRGDVEAGAAHNPQLLSWLSLAVVWVVWGSTFLAIRVAVQTIPPLLMTGTRYLAAGALLWAIVRAMQRDRTDSIRPSQWRNALINALLLLVLGTGSLAVGEVHLQSGTAALLLATIPLWMVAIDAVLARRLSRASTFGIVAGTIGIVALSGAPSARESPVSEALALLGALTWAIGSVYTRRQADSTTPLTTVVEMLSGGAILCILGVFGGEAGRIGAVPASSIIAWLWLVVAGSTIAYTAYIYAARTLPTTIVATHAYVNPVVAVILGGVLLHEPLTLNLLLGGAALITAVVAIIAGNRP